MMQHTKSLWALAVCLLVALVMLWMTPTAWAGGKEEVAAAARKWAETIGAADPDAMIKLYAKDAVFWGRLLARCGKTRRRFGSISSGQQKEFPDSR